MRPCCHNKHAVPGDGGKVLIAGEFCRINTALLMSRPLKTDGDGAFVHTLALSPCLPHMRFAGDSPEIRLINSGTTPV